MRMECKVYMSHTDMARVQAAARALGMTVSGYMRWCAIVAAESVGIPEYRSLLDGQREFELASQKVGVD